MKKYSILLFVLLLATVLIAFIPNAYAAIVPDCAVNQQACASYCDLLQLVKNVINFMMYIIFPIAAIAIVWGGYNVLFAFGSPERAKNGRSIITSAVIGLVIALLAWVIIDTIIKILAPNFSASNLGPWNQLQCNSRNYGPTEQNMQNESY